MCRRKFFDASLICMNMHILASRARLHAVRNGMDDVGRREVGQLGYFSIMMTSFERHSTGRPLFTGRFVKVRTSCNRLVSLFDLVANSLLPPWRQRTGSSNRHRRRNFTGQQYLPARLLWPLSTALAPFHGGGINRK